MRKLAKNSDPIRKTVKPMTGSTKEAAFGNLRTRNRSYTLLLDSVLIIQRAAFRRSLFSQ